MEASNNLKFVNSNAPSECMMYFLNMRQKGEKIDLYFKTEEGQEVSAHSMVLAAHFPGLRQLTENGGVTHVKLERFPREIVEIAIIYAYTGEVEMTSRISTRLYLLAHILKSQNLIKWCTEFLSERVNLNNASEIWLAANATKNDALTAASVSHIALNWELFKSNTKFLAGTDISGLRVLLDCERMGHKAAKEKLEAVSLWVASSRDKISRFAREDLCQSLIESIMAEEPAASFADIFAAFDELDLPQNCRWLLEKIWKDARERTRNLHGASGSASTSSRVQCEDRLATLDQDKDFTILKIHKTKIEHIEREFKLPHSNKSIAVPFQRKIAFIGNECKEVPLIDPASGNASSLPGFSTRKHTCVCAASGRHIFVLEVLGHRSHEMYDSVSMSWSPLPKLITDRVNFGAVYVPETGLFVVGGEKVHPRRVVFQTEMLVPENHHGNERWKWQPTTPLEFDLNWAEAICYRKTVYAISGISELKKIAMINFTAGIDHAQWTYLEMGNQVQLSISYAQIARVDSELNIYDPTSGDIYTLELNTNREAQMRLLSGIKRVKTIKKDVRIFTAEVSIS